MTCTIISTGDELNIACKNENELPYPEIKAKLREKIWELYCKGYDSFWINCEYDVQLWCGEIISALAMYNDIELNIAMPYEEWNCQEMCSRRIPKILDRQVSGGVVRELL